MGFFNLSAFRTPDEQFELLPIRTFLSGLPNSRRTVVIFRIRYFIHGSRTFSSFSFFSCNVDFFPFCTFSLFSFFFSGFSPSLLIFPCNFDFLLYCFLFFLSFSTFFSSFSSFLYTLFASSTWNFGHNAPFFGCLASSKSLKQPFETFPSSTLSSHFPREMSFFV